MNPVQKVQCRRAYHFIRRLQYCQDRVYSLNCNPNLADTHEPGKFAESGNMATRLHANIFHYLILRDITAGMVLGGGIIGNVYTVGRLRPGMLAEYRNVCTLLSTPFPS